MKTDLIKMALLGKADSAEVARHLLRPHAVSEQIELRDDESMDDYLDALSTAVKATLTQFASEDGEVYCSVRDVFDDKVVVRFWDGPLDGKMFEIPYTRQEDGSFSVGSLGQEVVARSVYVPVSEEVEQPEIRTFVNVLRDQSPDNAKPAREMRRRLSELQRDRALLPAEREQQMRELRDAMRASLRHVLPPELHATVDGYDDEGLMREFWAAFEVPHPRRTQSYETA